MATSGRYQKTWKDHQSFLLLFFKRKKKKKQMENSPYSMILIYV